MEIGGKNDIRTYRVRCAVLVTAIVLIAAKVWKKKSSKGENPLAELNELKEKGLITEQEYNEKKAEILSRGGKK